MGQWVRANLTQSMVRATRPNGMLFLYKDEAPVSFWMKNVSFPLDIIFVNTKGTIVKIHENAEPFDLTPIHSIAHVLSVLEIQGGASKRAQIKMGDTLRLSCVDQ